MAMQKTGLHFATSVPLPESDTKDLVEQLKQVSKDEAWQIGSTDSGEPVAVHDPAYYPTKPAIYYSPEIDVDHVRRSTADITEPAKHYVDGCGGDIWLQTISDSTSGRQ
jgi:hypothetical protein